MAAMSVSVFHDKSVLTTIAEFGGQRRVEQTETQYLKGPLIISSSAPAILQLDCHVSAV